MADVDAGEGELLIDGLGDDVALVWVLTHLGLIENPSADPGPPTTDVVEAALAVLARMSEAGLIRIGRTEYIDGGPPARLAPVRHVEEPLDVVRARVLRACTSGKDWEWSCWVVNTDRGDDIARSLLASR